LRLKERLTEAEDRDSPVRARQDDRSTPKEKATSDDPPVIGSRVAAGVYDAYSVYMPLPRPLCTRIPPELEAELETRFDDLEWSPSEGLRAIVSEWLALGRFSELEFRDTAVGRRAALRGGPEVWEVAAVAGPGFAADTLDPRVREHFSWVPAAALEQALAYAAAYPADITRIIERNRRLAGGQRS